MTIEERLEAITQTLELTARTAHDTERRLAEHQEKTALDQEKTALDMEAARDRATRLEQTMITQGEHVARFADSCLAWIETAERRFAELQEIARTNSKRLEIIEARF